MAGYYRSLLSDRRVLVILDNVATPDQARPLFPASPRRVVLVTSRSRMSGLVARDGARRITLDLLPSAEAITLLHDGSERRLQECPAELRDTTSVQVTDSLPKLPLPQHCCPADR